jgi:hypothetical protein
LVPLTESPRSGALDLPGVQASEPGWGGIGGEASKRVVGYFQRHLRSSALARHLPLALFGLIGLWFAYLTLVPWSRRVV